MNKFLYIALFFAGLFISSCGSSRSVSSSKAVDNSALDKAQTFYILADKARLNKEASIALENYEKCLALNPNHAAAYFYISEIKSEQNKFSEALEAITKARTLNKSNLYYKETHAELLIRNGKTDAGIAIYKELMDEQPNQKLQYQGMIANFYAYTGKFKDALNIYDEQEKKYGKSDELVSKRINVIKRIENKVEAAKVLDDMVKKYPEEIRYRLLQVEYLDKVKDAAQLQTAYTLLETQFAESPRALPLIALNKLRNKDTLGYQKYLSMLIANKEIDPEDKLRVLLPYTSKASTDVAAAKQLLNYTTQILEVAPNDTKALEIHAAALAQTEDYLKAANIYNDLLKNDAGKIANWVRVLSTYAQANRYDSVKNISKRALDFYPNQYEIFYYQGLANQFSEPNDIAAATKAYKKALDFSKTTSAKADVYALMGDMYHSAGNYKSSDSCFNESLRLEPKDAGTLNNYAYFLSVRKTNLDRALTMSNESLLLEPGNKTFLDTYAWILFQQKKYAEAETYILQAVGNNVADADADVLEHYGDILFKLNKNAEALKMWQLAKNKGSKSKLLNKKITDGKWYED